MIIKGSRWAWILAISVTAVAGLELSLRAIGLGDPPLYVESEAYEYIQAPEQDVVRFGNRIITNEYSMRSKSLRNDACPIVLFIGDSVVNGGAPTDQSELATTRIERSLQASGYPKAQTLNISAGSWGPDNAAAYLQQHGLFEADLVVAVFSSHDAADTMVFRPIVGVHSSYPEDKPLTAIGELFARYLWPRAKALFKTARRQRPKKHRAVSDVELNPGWGRLVGLADSVGIPLRFYLHPDREETEAGQIGGEEGQRIRTFLAEENAVTWEGLEADMDLESYRDGIHLSPEGQRRLAQYLYPKIAKLLEIRGPLCAESSQVPLK